MIILSPVILWYPLMKTQITNNYCFMCWFQWNHARMRPSSECMDDPVHSVLQDPHACLDPVSYDLSLSLSVIRSWSLLFWFFYKWNWGTRSLINVIHNLSFILFVTEFVNFTVYIHISLNSFCRFTSTTCLLDLQRTKAQISFQELSIRQWKFSDKFGHESRMTHTSKQTLRQNFSENKILVNEKNDRQSFHPYVIFLLDSDYPSAS